MDLEDSGCVLKKYFFVSSLINFWSYQAEYFPNVWFGVHLRSLLGIKRIRSLDRVISDLS